MLPALAPPYRFAFGELLALEGHDRLDQFLTVGSFDEVPLCSRLDRLDFLAGLAVADQNRLLIRAAVIHLEAIAEHARLRFAPGEDHHLRMVSVTGWCDYCDGGWVCTDGTGHLIAPNFWVGNLADEAVARFTMRTPETERARFVADALDGDADYRLSESRSESGLPGLERVFVQLAGHLGG